MSNILILGPNHQGECLVMSSSKVGWVIAQFWSWDNCPNLSVATFDLVLIQVVADGCGNENAHTEKVLLNSEIAAFLSGRGVHSPFVCWDQYGEVTRDGDFDERLLGFVTNKISGKLAVWAFRAG
ncbi:MAG: hypothetical protein WCO03_01770 [bacterium]